MNALLVKVQIYLISNQDFRTKTEGEGILRIALLGSLKISAPSTEMGNLDSILDCGRLY